MKLLKVFTSGILALLFIVVILAKNVSADTINLDKIESFKAYDQSEYPESYRMLEEAINATEDVGYFDPDEMSYLEVKNLIREIERNSRYGRTLKNWVAYKSGKVEFNYMKDQEVIKAKREEVERKAEQVLKEIISPHFTDFEKVKAVHDYLVLHTEYDYENYYNDTIPRSAYNSYGPLMKGFAVCDGYTRAAALLLDKLGIENVYVQGYLSNGSLHSWNLVMLDGEFYHMDVTWNDTSGQYKDSIQYQYFLLNDDEISNTRIWKKENYPSPSKKSLEGSYQ